MAFLREVFFLFFHFLFFIFFYYYVFGRRPKGHPRTRCRDYVEDLSWSRFGIPAEHLPFVAEDRDAWRIQLERAAPAATPQE